MKKKILLILTVSILYSGCYDDDGTAKVRINLGNMPVARHEINETIFERIFSIFVKNAYTQTLPTDLSVTAIHLVAIKGSSIIAVESMDTTDMLTNDNTVEFSVPAGNDITIVVLGEKDYMPMANIQDIEYYGKNETTLNLSAGETTDVQITMAAIETALLKFNSVDEGLVWEGLPGISSYKIYDGEGTLVTSTAGTIYFGYDYNYMILEFDYIDKSSNQFNI